MFGGLESPREGQRKRDPANEGSLPYCFEARGYLVMVDFDRLPLAESSHRELKIKKFIGETKAIQESKQ